MEFLRKGFGFYIYLPVIIYLTKTLAEENNPFDLNKTPYWISPCNWNQDPNAPKIATGDNISEKEFYSKVVIVTNNAIDQLVWLDAWSGKNFDKDFQAIYSNLNSSLNSRGYLPGFSETNKHLGEPIPDDILDGLDGHEELKKTYEWLQRLAVGMEQVAHDMFDNNDEFWKDLFNANDLLRVVLCEIYDVMSNLNVTDYQDVERSVMRDTERYITDETDRKIRDVTIIVFYYNVLEYIKQAYEKLAE